MYKNIKILTSIILLAIGSAKAQEGFGTNNPAPSSVVDMVSGTKGVLLPRVALTSTTVATPVAAPTEALTVFNTRTTGDVTPGYYYWSVDKWVRLLDDPTVLALEPWQVESTTTKANLNTQNIYQNGNIGIGDFTASNPIAKLDVRGAVRGGTENTGDIGLNSATFGSRNEASGQESFAAGVDNIASGSSSVAFGDFTTASGHGSASFGYHSVASGERSFASGNMAQASGNFSLALGESSKSIGYQSTAIGPNTTANAQESMALGTKTTASGLYSMALGNNTTAASQSETVLGLNNAVTSGSASIWVLTDPLLQLGNGNATASNALTILKNGNIGTDLAIAPTQRLDIGSGNVRVRDINANTGLATDNVVVADGTGILKTVASSSLAGNDWHTTGNAGTTSATNFLGTTDAQDVVLRSNNLERVRVTQTGRLDFSNTSGSATNIFIEGGNETTTGIWNTAVGRSALNAVTSGNQNTAFGASALQATTTGADNTAIGQRALSNVTSGFSNTAVGLMAGNAVTTANSNVLVGSQAGLVLTTGVSNVFVGTGAGGSTASGRNNIAIGQGVSLPTTNGDYQLNIGNTIFGTGLTGSVLAPVGKIGINTVAPNSTLQVAGSLSLPIRSTIESTTLTDADYKLLVRGTSGVVNIALPDPITCAGRIYVVANMREGVSSLAVTFDKAIVSTNSGGEVTINSGTGVLKDDGFRTVTLQSDGTDWIAGFVRVH